MNAMFDLTQVLINLYQNGFKDACEQKGDLDSPRRLATVLQVKVQLEQQATQLQRELNAATRVLSEPLELVDNPSFQPFHGWLAIKYTVDLIVAATQGALRDKYDRLVRGADETCQHRYLCGNQKEHLNGRIENDNG